MRDAAEQVCPAFWMPALTRNGRARSGSASANTSCGDLPPSSSVTGATWRAAAACTSAPTATEPVKEMCLTPGWAASAAPASSPRPGTTLSAPAGKPASRARSASASEVRQASSAGLSTQALPIASAAPMVRLAQGVDRIAVEIGDRFAHNLVGRAGVELHVARHRQGVGAALLYGLADV